MPASVFLSHNRSDKPFARRIAADLLRAGADVWLDEDQIQLGDSIQDAIQEGIDDCEYLAVILSPDAVNSRWVQTELKQALQREINADRVVVLPLLYRDCEIPGFLRDKLHADFRAPEDYEDALNLLKKRLGLTPTQAPEELALSETVTMELNHRLRQDLSALRSRLANLASASPELEKDLDLVASLSTRAERTSREPFLVQSFATGQYPVRIDPEVRLDELLASVVSDQSQFVDPNRNLQFKIDAPDSMPPQPADPELLSLAFAALLDNAIRYSFNDSAIEILVRPKPYATGATIEFHNMGPPVLENATDDIFARGYRGKMAQLVTSGGQGMGLYIARLIIASHGGEILFSAGSRESENVFSVHLPIEPARARET